MDYFNALEDRLTRRRWKTGFRVIPYWFDGRPGIGDGIPRRIGETTPRAISFIVDKEFKDYFEKHPEKCVPGGYIRCKSLNPLVIDEEAEESR